jgi:transposase, IS5 family
VCRGQHWLGHSRSHAAACADGLAIEAVIGHMKAEGHLGRCHLKGRAGDAANVILSAVGYNLRLVLAWLRIILRVIPLALLQTFTSRPALKPAS